MRVLVTGGAGLLGAAIARRLLEAGQSVLVADAFSPDGDGRALRGGRAAALKERGAEIRRLDLADAPSVQEVLEGFRPEVVVNAARLPAEADVQPLAGVAKSVGAELLVHVSDSDLYGSPAEPGVRASEEEPLAPEVDPRLAARARDEETLRASGIPFVIFRAFELVSPDLPPGRTARDLADAVLAGRAVALPDEEGRDFLHLEDSARAIHLAITRRPAGRTLNLGSGIAVSLRALAEEITRQAGLSEVSYARAPFPLRPPRVADPTAAWDVLRFAPELPLPRIAAAALESARRPQLTSRVDPEPEPAPPAPSRGAAVSRREMFGIFRRPFSPRK